ncbi:MAG: 50S ribosomal protein L23 [Candidatus Aenigmarchaeota archaeon]|nr:50S ribosomal protein L23 [Candidatus Aenigmarchaeota archaeon]
MREDEQFWELIDYPVTTEKAVRIIEDENKLTFQLKKISTNKEEIKKSFEGEFKVKVEKINALINRKGKKRIIIKLKKEFPAGDIGVKLGII